MGVMKVADPCDATHVAAGVKHPDQAPLPGPSGWRHAWDARWNVAGVRSLEVRWIFAGRLTTAMAGWFGRFPAQTITLADDYLVAPYLPGLSVKVREGQALEVKAYHGDRGLLEVPGRALGRLQAWQKWSFPGTAGAQGSGDPAGWRTVRKRRRICRFAGDNAPVVADAPGPGTVPECAVELAEFRVTGEDWWTLAFEATGPVDVLHGRLSAAAALVFSRSLPGVTELDMNDSMSYAQWLRSRLGHRSVPRPRGGNAR